MHACMQVQYLGMKGVAVATLLNAAIDCVPW